MPISKTDQELLAQKDETILALENKIKALETKIKTLNTKIEFERGAPIEELVKEWTEGTRMSYKYGHDVTTKNGTRLEVKFSSVNTPKPSIKRWTWSSLLGQNEKKDFHFLVLAGVKDKSYEYPALPFVFFIVPREVVDDITRRGSFALNTNLDIVRANNQKSVMMKRYLVHSQNAFDQFKILR
jgi:restriction endonuclease S subunit